jgi:hypothetical protein
MPLTETVYIYLMCCFYNDAVSSSDYIGQDNCIKRLWKDAVMAQFEVCTEIFLKGLRKTNITLLG